MTKERKYSFNRGMRQVRIKDKFKVREEIMEALGITTIATFNNRLYGKVEPRASEAEAIEAVFAKYSITEVWGEK